MAAIARAAERRISTVREFNRFYTQKIGVLRDGLLDSDYTLTEVRVLYEIANRTRPLAADLVRDLSLDAGYLSRILTAFARRGWLKRERSGEAAERGLEAANQSFSEANKGFQALAAQMTDYSKRAFDDAIQTWEQLIGVRSVEKALDIQSQYAKRVYENHMAELSKLAEMYTAMMRDASKPIRETSKSVR